MEAAIDRAVAADPSFNGRDPTPKERPIFKFQNPETFDEVRCSPHPFPDPPQRTAAGAAPAPAPAPLARAPCSPRPCGSDVSHAHRPFCLTFQVRTQDEVDAADTKAAETRARLVCGGQSEKR